MRNTKIRVERVDTFFERGRKLARLAAAREIRLIAQL